MSSDKTWKLFEAVVFASRSYETANFAFDEAAYAALGVNRTDGRCMDMLNLQGSMTAGMIASESGLTTAAVTSVLDRLEKLGYVKRERDTEDRRRVNVALTEKAQQRAMEIWRPLGKDAFEGFAEMSTAELEAVIRFFEFGKELNQRHVERVKQLRFD